MPRAVCASLRALRSSCGVPWGCGWACALLAGIIGLLNAERLAAGKPTIGFFNQLLYQVYAESPDAFTDIVVCALCTGAVCVCPLHWGFALRTAVVCTLALCGV